MLDGDRERERERERKKVETLIGEKKYFKS
jgi:hypothetical protein